MEAKYHSAQAFIETDDKYQALAEENILLRKEIQVARRAAELTANLVVKQFEETEKVLPSFLTYVHSSSSDCSRTANSKRTSNPFPL